ncbi:MAG: NADH-quinone oxidoreductase subunit A [Pseudomonadales bacterium]
MESGVNDGAVPAAIEASQNLWPFLIYALSVVALLAIALIVPRLVGAKTHHNEATDIPFESGVVPVGSADQTRLTIEFYLIAMFFVIFDLETIFIFAWAVAFFELGWRGYVGASVFIIILMIALFYEWRTGALDWGQLRRGTRAGYSRTESS